MVFGWMVVKVGAVAALSAAPILPVAPIATMKFPSTPEATASVLTVTPVASEPTPQAVAQPTTQAPSPATAQQPPMSQAAVAAWANGLSWPWGCIAWYESTDNPDAVNPLSGDSGLFQIQQSTWDEYGGQQFAATPVFASPQDQLIVAQRIAQGYTTPRGFVPGQGYAAWQTAPLCGA